MAVKTTLSFTERHHGFLLAKVREGIFATQSAVVAAAVEQMIQDRGGAGSGAVRACRRNPRARAHAAVGVRGSGTGIFFRACYD